MSRFVKQEFLRLCSQTPPLYPNLSYFTPLTPINLSANTVVAMRFKWLSIQSSGALCITRLTRPLILEAAVAILGPQTKHYDYLFSAIPAF
jgi:hypothetical protein